MPVDPASPAHSEWHWEQLQNCKESQPQQVPQPGWRHTLARTAKAQQSKAYNECTNEVLDTVWIERRIRLGQLCEVQGSFTLREGALLKRCLLGFAAFDGGRCASNLRGVRPDRCQHLLRLSGLFAGSGIFINRGCEEEGHRTDSLAL